MANVKWLGSTNAVQTVGEPVSTDSRPSFGIWPLLAAAGAAIAAYHGYKRNRGDTGAAVGWGVLGAFFPIITVPVALAQGYAEPKSMLGNPLALESNPRRRTTKKRSTAKRRRRTTKKRPTAKRRRTAKRRSTERSVKRRPVVKAAVRSPRAPNDPRLPMEPYRGAWIAVVQDHPDQKSYSAFLVDVSSREWREEGLGGVKDSDGKQVVEHDADFDAAVRRLDYRAGRKLDVLY